MNRSDFIILEIENWDVLEYWIKKRKKLFWNLISTNKFKLIMDWDAPLSFKSRELAEEYIQKTFLHGN